MLHVYCYFCPNPLFDWLLGPHKGQNLEKKKKKKKHSKFFSSETFTGVKPVLCILVPLHNLCFYSSRIRTLVAMVTLSFHRLIMGKVEISYFSGAIADM